MGRLRNTAMMSQMRQPWEFSSRPQISEHDDLETILGGGGLCKR